MWGTSFSDLARKAQELQDQAAEAATHAAEAATSLSTQPTKLFNLDSMQNQEAAATTHRETPEMKASAPSSSSSNSGTFLSAPIVPPVKAAVRPPGMLKVPVINVTQPQQPEEPQPEVNQQSAADNPVVKEDEGWVEEDEDIDLDDDVPGEAALESVQPRTKKSTLEQAGTEQSGSLATTEAPVEGGSTKEEKEDEQSQKENGSGGSAAPLVQTQPDTVPESKDGPSKQPPPSLTKPGEEETVPQSMAENETQSEPPSIPQQQQQETTGDAEPTISVPHTDSAIDESAPAKRRLVMLISSLPMNRQVQTRQDLAQTALKANGIDFECMDGATEEHRELRNQLFETSGIRGEYPQFFLVDLSNGGTTFWGTFEKFQHTNDDGKLVEEFGNPEIPETPVNASSPPVSEAVPDAVLEHFSHQMKRIEENFQLERIELERQHDLQLKELEMQHETTLLSQKEVQDQLRVEIQEKEVQLQELCRRNEGYRLKLDVLKREVTGTQELLEAKGKDAGKTAEHHLHELRAMEKKLVAAESDAEKAREECNVLQGALDTARNELATTVQEHNELKERVKEVATELKDRRVECRELKAKIDELMDQNSAIKTSADSLQERLNHQGVSQTEKDDEMTSLREKLDAMAKEMEKAKQEWKAIESKHEVVLADYKKKAQHSLSMANSRTAAAVQAREEAEMDARAARTTADSAFERATKAEIGSRQAVAEAKAAVQAMESEKNRAIQELEEAKMTQRTVEERVTVLQSELEKVVASRDSKIADLEKIRGDWNTECSRANHAEVRLVASKNEVDLLRREVESLKDQVMLAEAAASASEPQNAPENERPVVQASPSTDSMYRPTEDATVDALQQELREANETIEGLKESLKKAVQATEQNGNEASESSAPPLDESNRSAYSAAGQPTDAVPLFYAMEKQAELKTARAEINRLASVLADVQSEKSEAREAMEDMRRRMEEAEARLRRFEKLGSAKRNSSNNISGSIENGSGPPPQNDSGAVNIEYLKHILFKFLSAKTVNEKKALVPVIGAVLELTPDELSAAIKSVEQRGSISSAATSMFGFM